MTDQHHDNRLTDDQRVFVGLIEEILQETEGLRYHRAVGAEEIAAGREGEDEELDDGTYAIFVIDTNPLLDLAVSFELAERAIRIQVNEKTFAHKMDSSTAKKPEKWMENRCRDVERMVSGNIKLIDDTFFGRVLATELVAGEDDKWHEIGDWDTGWGWIALLSWFVSFGLPITSEQETVYTDWFSSSEDG